MTKTRLSFLLLFLAVLAALSCTPGRSQEPASLVIMDARIATLNPEQPDAEALAVVDGRISAIGSNEEVTPCIGENTRVISLRRQGLVIPGFIDGHAHFTGIGEALRQIDLTTARSWRELVELVEQAAAETEPGEWILGRGWHQAKWKQPPDPAIEGLPLHDELSKATPDNPVLLVHASGHSCLANARAMQLSGVTSDTVNPEGGEIVKTGNGNPIGAFRETAQGLIKAALRESLASRSPDEVESDLRETIELAASECVSKGITSLHDAGSSFELVDLLKEMADKGDLKIRLNVMLSESNSNLKKRISDYRLVGYGGEMLTVRSIKRLIDGALGSHGAWLLEPYSDLPSSTGLQTYPSDALRETAEIALANGFQVAVHAIGDRANREVLDIYQDTLNGDKDARWRIEHAQHLAAGDIPRFASLGVLAAMQSIHCTSDGPWVEEKLGAGRASEGAYVWRSLLDSGAVIGNGTDAPVEDVDPLKCYYAAVTRRMENGERFYPGQCMTRLEALQSYTINNAYLAFEEDIKGSLETGKLADITILSRDILTVPENELLETEALYTIVGGKVLYERD